jgi:hypothetical protein
VDLWDHWEGGRRVTRKPTTDTVEKYLARYGVPARTIQQLGESQGVVHTQLDVLGTAYLLEVDPVAETGLLEFRVPRLLHATLDDTPADRVHGLLLVLATLNYRLPLVSLGYDPRDGEVALRYGLPTLGGSLAYEDLERVLVVIENVLARHVEDLRAVVAGVRTAQEILG